MTLVVVPFCAMLAPCSMLSRTPRAAPKERGAGSKIPLDNPSPIQGFELANVESQRLPSHGSSAGAHWQAGQLAAHENSRVVKMTFASSNQAVRGTAPRRQTRSAAPVALTSESVKSPASPSFARPQLHP